MALDTGLSTVLRVCSLIILKIFSMGFSMASSCFQPVKASATGFKKEMLPFVSVVITASPILLSVIENHSSHSFNASSILLRAFFSIIFPFFIDFT